MRYETDVITDYTKEASLFDVMLVQSYEYIIYCYFHPNLQYYPHR